MDHKILFNYLLFLSIVGEGKGYNNSSSATSVHNSSLFLQKTSLDDEECVSNTRKIDVFPSDGSHSNSSGCFESQYYCVDDLHYDKEGSLKCFYDTNITGTFVSPNLQPGQVAPILWREDGKRVTENAFQVGLPEKLTTELLNYCDRVGMTELFRKLISSDPIPPSEEHQGVFVEMKDGNRWYAQRPAKEWRSNMHWLSPADETTHEEYLRVLAEGDFDSVLEGIGTSLGMKGLAAYHLTFIAVSNSIEGFIHYDTSETGANVFNVIIPLILEDDAPPELILVDDSDEERIGGLKYRLGAGVAIGDDTMHGTLECDYRKKGGMRMAATVYIADISEDNVNAIATQTLTQIFPLPDTNWLMAQETRHWGGKNRLAGDKGRKPFRFDNELNDCNERARAGMCESDTEETRQKCLKSCRIYIEEGPKKIESVDDMNVHICTQNRTGHQNCRLYEDTDSPGTFISPKLDPGELFPIVWREDRKKATEYAFQIGLPPKLTKELLDYCQTLGITDLFRSLVGSDPIPAQLEHSGKIIELNDGNKWYAQRPAKKWRSNMHWVSPADEKTHEEYLKVLARGDFDLVLDAIGTYLGLKGLVAYHLTFIGVSHSVRGFVHHDFLGTGASVYNVIVPLILEEDESPELIITDSDDERVGALKYQIGAGGMMGDEALHGTAACDYRDKGGMRMAATIYIADINESNAEAIATQTLTQIFPLPDTDWLMAQAGRHWGGSSSLTEDHGRKKFEFEDELDDCGERSLNGICESDIDYTRPKCLKSCGVYNTA